MTLYDLKQEDDNIRDYLKVSDYENWIKIYVDSNGNYVYNMNSGLYLNVSQDLLKEFECKSIMQWPLISYKIYNSTRYSWLLQKINEVKAEDIFKPKMPGDVILYLDSGFIKTMIENLNADILNRKM